MTSSPPESNPTQAADRFLALIQQARRGRFKLYLGMSAGVGKTYRMLEEAHALLGRGVNVLVGLAVTHDRADTARLLEGLPTQPERQLFYKGMALSEMDLEGIIRAKPELVIVDELAHTNVPGSVNEKRWQDVEALLKEGISVISALNIQHIESLNPTIERITGVAVAERVPDRIIGLADEVVNIDLTADELLQRLKDGKIYKPEKIQLALQGFFVPEHLLQLRELALREVAHRVEQQIDGQVQPGQRVRQGRLCASISTNEKAGRHIIRKVARLAEFYDSKWYVTYVQTPREGDNTISLASQRQLINNFKLATELGAEVVRLKNPSIADALITFCLANQVTLLVLGKPHRTWLQRMRYGDLVHQLSKTHREKDSLAELDILLIS